MKHFLPTALAAALLMAAPAFAQRAALISVDTVAEQLFAERSPVVGTLVARQGGIVAAQTGGQVAELMVQVGTTVKEGEVLVRLDTRRLSLARQQAGVRQVEAAARLNAARAELALARQRAERLEPLALQGTQSVSRASYDDAVAARDIAAAQVEIAEQQLAGAEANLALAKLNLTYAEITAPYTGTVVERLSEMGSYVQTGQPVVRLLADRDLEVAADVPQALIAGLEPGMEVPLEINDQTHRAKIRAIVPEEEARTRTRPVRFTPQLSGDAGRLAAGQSVRVWLPSGPERKALSIHKDALVRRGGQVLVFVVDEGVAKPRPVQTGVTAGARIEVIGLAPGEQVVVRGNEGLQPGQQVQVRPNA